MCASARKLYKVLLLYIKKIRSDVKTPCYNDTIHKKGEAKGMSDGGKSIRKEEAMREFTYDGSSAVVRTRVFAPKHAYSAYREFSDFAAHTVKSDTALTEQFGGSEERALFGYSLFRRKALKNGIAPSDKVPFTFAKLLFTEIINADERYSPEEAVGIMMAVIGLCADILSRAECESLFDIVSDFCLVNGEELPFDEKTLSFSDCDFVKETLLYRFFRSLENGITENSRRLSLAVVSEVCGFDYKNGAAYRENPSVCERAISDCVCAHTEMFFSENGGVPTPLHASLTKTVYCGLAVRSELSVKVETEYLSYGAFGEYLTEAGETAKYADNTLRRAFGAKSIIPGIKLGQNFRTMVQKRIAAENPTLFNPKKRGRKPKPRPDVTVPAIRPEPPRKTEVCVDIGRAKELEESSWDIAKRLGVEYGEDELIVLGENGKRIADETDSSDVPADTAEYDPENEWEAFAASLGGDCAEIVVRLLEDGDVRAYAAAKGAIADAYFAMINDIASDITGDIVIDPSSQRILPDYEEELLGVLPLLKKIAPKQKG